MRRIFFWSYLLLLIFVFVYFVVENGNATSAIPNICPSNQLYFGPCIVGACPPECPVVCTCIGRRDCCTTLGRGGNGSNDGDGGSISSNVLTRLLLALLLSSPPSNIGGPKARLSLVICRDLALNCALYTFYCALPVYSLCMRTNCAATCGLCNDGGGLLGMPLLLSLLGFNGLNGNTRNQIISSPNTINSNNDQLPQQPSSPNAIRSGAPPIREENNDDEDENDKNNITTKVENNFNNITIQNSFGNFPYIRRKESINNNQATKNNIQPLNFAIPPGLQILDHHKIKEHLIKIGAI